MSCTNTQLGELMALYEFGELSGDEKREFEDHLLSCDHCFQSLYALSPVVARLRENPELFLPALRREVLWGIVKMKITAVMTDFRIRRRMWIAIPVAAAAMALLLLLLRPSVELADLARLEPVPYHSLQVKSGTATTDAERLFDEGVALYVQKDYAGAAEKLQIAGRLDSTNATFQFYLGLSYLLADSVETAIRSLHQATALGSGSILEKAYWYLGTAWLMKNDRERALAALQKVVEMEGDYQWEAGELIEKISKLAER